MKIKNLNKLIFAALMIALTCIATMIIKFPTPTLGYIHVGDAFVLLSGIILGPLLGGFAAGVGSMFADLFSGYVAWAPATFIIKALSALVAGAIYRVCYRKHHFNHIASICFSGFCGEFLMVLGYFGYSAVLSAFGTGAFNKISLSAGIASAALGVPFNIAQGVVGIVLCSLLLPIFKKINVLNQMLES